MKKICVVTATRAEYFLLAPIIKKLMQQSELDVRVVATGAHLSPEFGLTVNNIIADGIPVDRRIEILFSADTPSSISKTMGSALFGFADYFAETCPDALMVLGDRYELLAVCCAAMNARIPIIHLYGGETTEGAVDEAVRHAITKLSSLHFAANEVYAKRIIQMGEQPERVFVVGAMGPENAIYMPKMSIAELENSLNCHLGDNYAVLTFHPVTLENDSARAQAEELIKAIERYPNMVFLCTKANADADGRVINSMLSEYTATHENAYLFDSLGSKRYLSALTHACFAIGNSSSGLSEVPSIGIPTINIGDRQKGRMKGPSVIDCEPKCDSICEAIEKAFSPEMVETAAQRINPYGDGNASSKIAEITVDHLVRGKFDLKKKFYDVAFTSERG